MYDGTRTTEYPGRPYALDVERLSEGKGNGGPSAPRSREIRRRMQTAHTYGQWAYDGLLTVYGTEVRTVHTITFTPIHPPICYQYGILLFTRG